jgi:hypothetical protein
MVHGWVQTGLALFWTRQDKLGSKISLAKRILMTVQFDLFLGDPLPHRVLESNAVREVA